MPKITPDTMALAQKYQDEFGKPYGEWLVLGIAPRANSGRVRMFCLCSCGQTKSVQLNVLKSGESDTAFAKRAGVWVTTLQGTLRGKEPKDKTLQTIAEHLGCTAVYLRYGIGEAPVPSPQSIEGGTIRGVAQ